MSSNPNIKNYYAILGVPQSSTLFEIENAFEKLATKWHPDRHKEHRKTAEARFHDIAEAFDVLSDHNKRAHYDEMLHREYSLTDAQSTFNRFFSEQGALDENEEKFLNENFPSPLSTYYTTLGVKKDSTLDDIKNAYRKLAIKYHPKNNPNDQEAAKKFIEVNEAFNALSSEFKRQNYDKIVFGTIAPVQAHNIFDEFFGSRPVSVLEEEFWPQLRSRWSRNLDRLMLDESEEGIKDGQTVKTSSVWSNKNGQETSKTLTTRRTFKGGRADEERIEDYVFPTGERKVTRTTNIGGKIESKEYRLKKGEPLPKQISQGTTIRSIL